MIYTQSIGLPVNGLNERSWNAHLNYHWANISTMKKPILIVLVLLNVVVLLGQLWPEGAPPFARYVNIAFLLATLFHFINAWRKGSSKADRTV